MSKICVGMSDEERKEILDEKELKVPFSSDKIKIINEEEKLIDVAREILERDLNKNTIAVKLYEEFFQKSNLEKNEIMPFFKNEDIELEFEYSKGGMKESISKQYSSYDDFAKMLTCFNDVVKNGIGLEVHENRYNFDMITDKVFVLVSAFRDEKNLYPVKMEIKTFKNTNSERVKEKPKLYVLITSEHFDIKEEGILFTLQDLEDPYSPKTPSIVKISHFLEKVNQKSEKLIKYTPDGYLGLEELKVKKKVLEEERKYILKKNLFKEERQQRREERRATRERKENQEKNKQPPETKPLSLAEKNLMALREKKAREKDKGIEK